MPLYLLGFTMVTQSGEYVTQIILAMGTDLPIVVVALCEVICILFYGVQK